MDLGRDTSNGTVEMTESLVQKYYSFGFQHKEILAFLKMLHEIDISLRTLKRILSRLKLFRKENYSPIEDVVGFIESEISKSGQLHGYKWMHLRCLQKNFVVTQIIVREILGCLDPEGVNIQKRKRLRRRQYQNKGPNHLWHMDSYDKLKPYGICVNGCIDGFSRHIIWLRVGCISTDPKIVAVYFLDSLKILGGCPKTVRCDMGTENKTVEKIQKTLCELFDETASSRPSFIYGRSTHNQRIEACWGILRKHSAQFWMNLFQSLRDDDIFDGSSIDKSLIQFCFGNIIQEDMVVMEWNTHRISRSKNSIAPTGRPAVMFEMPSCYDAQNYLVNVPSFAFEALNSECHITSHLCDPDVKELCELLMEENHLHHDDDPYSARDLYMQLRRMLIPLFGH